VADHVRQGRQRGFRRGESNRARWRKAIAIRADAAESEAVKAAIEKTVATFGQLDVLVNKPAQPFRKPSRRPRSRRWIA